MGFIVIAALKVDDSSAVTIYAAMNDKPPSAIMI